jgi:hypothetical protein
MGKEVSEKRVYVGMRRLGMRSYSGVDVAEISEDLGQLETLHFLRDRDDGSGKFGIECED